MINYRFDEEKSIILHYAAQFSDDLVKNIIERGKVSDSEEALHLSKFFWQMVDESIKDIDAGKTVCGQTDLE